MSGIYYITNIINNKFYIGSSVNVGRRFAQHKRKLKKNDHPNPKLQNAWNKYGEENFKFETVCSVLKDDLIPVEQFYLDVKKPWYNIALCAQAPSRGRKLGPCSESRKKAISDVQKGNQNRKGIAHTQETKDKISVVAKGRAPWNKGLKTGPLSEENRLKKSLARKKYLSHLKAS